MNHKPLSTKQEVPKSVGRRCAGIIGIVFMIVGLLVWWVIAIGPLFASLGSNDWVEVPCEIVKSELVHGRKSSLRPGIEFKYRFGSEQRLSDQYDFTTLNRRYARCKKILDQYPVGKQTTCFVDPQRPEKAVIVRKYDVSFFGFFFPLLFVVVGTALAWFTLTVKSEETRKQGFLRKQTAKFRSAGKTAVAYDDSLRKHPGDMEDEALNGLQCFKPGVASLARFLMVLLFAVAWNGFVVYESLHLDRSLEPVSVLIPIGAMGLLLIAGAVYFLLSFLNPKVTLTLSNGTVERGGSLDVAWRLEGSTSRIRSLVINVEGEESVSYSSEDSRSSSFFRHVFCSIPIVNATRQGEIDFGKKSINIPTEVMHSFASEDNSVSWNVVVKGEIPWWPDIIETYTFRVKP